MAAEAPTATMIASGLPDLLHELPFEVPSEFPDYGGADDATVYELVRRAVKDVNPTYEHPPADLQNATDPVEERARRLLKTGGTALMVATQEGLIDIAIGDEEPDYRYMQTYKIFMGAPAPVSELGRGASVAVCLSAESSREDRESSEAEATHTLKAAWEIRIPNLDGLSAFGISEEDVTSMVPSATGTIVEQFFGALSAEVVRDMPVIRSDDPVRDLRESERRQGIIHGAYVQGALRNRLLAIGAVILEPYEPNSFQNLEIRTNI